MPRIIPAAHLEVGELFVWNKDVYQVKSHRLLPIEGNIEVTRLASMQPDGSLNTVGQRHLFVEKFNGCADVNPCKMSVIYE